MQLLDRPGSAWEHGRKLLLDNHEPRDRQRRHVRRTLSLYKALRTSGVVRQREQPDEWGRFVEVDHALQDDFALDQLLAPFLLHAIPQLDRDDPGYAFAVLAFVEAVVDNPMPILMAQRDKAKDAAMAAMKADHVQYEERIERLEKINYPQPMRDEIYHVFDEWRDDHPWIGDRNIAPKGVVRDIWEQAMDFPTFIRHYGLKRSEGLLLRYLSDVFKTIGRSIPARREDGRTRRDRVMARRRDSRDRLVTARRMDRDVHSRRARPTVPLPSTRSMRHPRSTSPLIAAASRRSFAPGCSVGCNTPRPANGRRGRTTWPRPATVDGTNEP